MVQVMGKKGYAPVREELKVTILYCVALDVKYAYGLRLYILFEQKSLTGSKLTRKELFLASQNTHDLQKMSKLQMQLMVRDDHTLCLS